MTASEKLHEFAERLAAVSRGRSQAASVESSPVNDSTTANPPLPLAGLDLDTAIHLRWVLRDIKAKRTKLTPLNSEDVQILIEVGLVEMRDDVPVLTNQGHCAID
jgi:hypothetical protein